MHTFFAHRENDLFQNNCPNRIVLRLIKFFVSNRCSFFPLVLLSNRVAFSRYKINDENFGVAARIRDTTRSTRTGLLFYWCGGGER